MNRQPTEMPFISDNLRIVREGDVVRVEYAGGMVTLLNPKLDVYKVTVSGWYHGRVAGMLGAYDNEPSRSFYDGLCSSFSCLFNSRTRPISHFLFRVLTPSL